MEVGDGQNIKQSLSSCLKLTGEITFYQLHIRGSRKRKMEYICTSRYYQKSGLFSISFASQYLLHLVSEWGYSMDPVKGTLTRQ